eukprot:6271496-Pyramimonas_sp.AAC.1
MKRTVQCKSGLRDNSCPMRHHRSASGPAGESQRDSYQPEHTAALSVVYMICPALSRTHTHR